MHSFCRVSKFIVTEALVNHKLVLTHTYFNFVIPDDCVNIANVLRYLGRGRTMDLRPTSTLRKTHSGFRVLNVES